MIPDSVCPFVEPVPYPTCIHSVFVVFVWCYDIITTLHPIIEIRPLSVLLLRTFSGLYVSPIYFREFICMTSIPFNSKCTECNHSKTGLSATFRLLVTAGSRHKRWRPPRIFIDQRRRSPRRRRAFDYFHPSAHPYRRRTGCLHKTIQPQNEKAFGRRSHCFSTAKPTQTHHAHSNTSESSSTARASCC